MLRFPTKTARRARGALPALVGAAVAATALGAYAAVSTHHRKAPFTIRATPASLTLAPGGIARYRITIYRHHFLGRVHLRVKGIPRRATARIAFVRHSRSRAVLTVFTSLRTRRRRYRLQVRATHGRLHAGLPFALTVDPARPARFTIAGDAIGPLWPGIPRPLDLALANPNNGPIQVTGLTVGIAGVTAPHATDARPCSREDFRVQQFTGNFPVTVPARSNRSLDLAGIPSPSWPQVEIINRAIDQDGCQGATLSLSYSGTARTP
jgi:hypothetical protein